jgi:hypothetical protein
MKNSTLTAALLLLFIALISSCSPACDDPNVDLPFSFRVEKSTPNNYANFLEENGSVTDIDGNEFDWGCGVVSCTSVIAYFEDSFTGGSTSETVLLNFPNGNIDTLRIEFSGERDDCDEWIVNDDTEIFRNDSLLFTGDFRSEVFVFQQ